VPRLVGLELPGGAALPRPGDTINHRGSVVGYVTNAAYCPTLERRLARACIAIGFSEPGTRVTLGGSDAQEAVVAATYRWYDQDNLRLK